MPDGAFISVGAADRAPPPCCDYTKKKSCSRNKCEDDGSLASLVCSVFQLGNGFVDTLFRFCLGKTRSCSNRFV